MISILLGKASCNVVNLKITYSVYGWDLEDAFKDETSSPFEDLLVKVLNRPRFDETGISFKNNQTLIDNFWLKTNFSLLVQYLQFKLIERIFGVMSRLILKLFSKFGTVLSENPETQMCFIFS